MLETEHDQYTISVKNAKKSYGEKKVLNDFCMKVPRGCIYGLLGASGCGKTTLFNCVLGLKQIDSGEVYVLGGKPGTPESGVPGSALGYMPQEIALVAELTIKDTVYYFGRIHDMNESAIKERFEMLKVLLELPPDERLLKNCSDGQQRRVSLAVAMVHKPQLLILDEPTVGLDLVLRDTIWNHFIEISEKEQTTIIITTHYIEEARQAHKIGLMREGVLLVEESPERLLQLFNTECLEEVFLILGKNQEERRHNLHEDPIVTTMPPLEANKSGKLLMPGPKQKKQLNNQIGAFRFNKKHVKSLMSKNTKQFFRNLSGMAFTFSIPILLVMAYLTAVGRNPRDLKIAIVNEDAKSEKCANYNKQGTVMPDGFGNCHFTDLACRFLNEIENPMFDLEYYDNLNDAFEDVRHGEVIGLLHMEQNFSNAYSNRINMGRHVSSEDLSIGEIKVWLDMSNFHVCEAVWIQLYRLFENYQVSALKDCNYSATLESALIRFNVLYGTMEEEYTKFFLPGILLSVNFWLGLTLTSTIMVAERQEGVWDRVIVAGVSSLEFVITHFATQFMLVLIQTCELIIMAFMFYDEPYAGHMYLIFLFTLLQGLVGMAFGFWISVVSKNLSAAHVMTTGLFFSLIFLSGIFWPIEGQVDGLQQFSYCLPFSIPIVSLRQVIRKGYGLDEWQVYTGLSVTILWIVIPLLMSICAIKAKR